MRRGIGGYAGLARAPIANPVPRLRANAGRSRPGRDGRGRTGAAIHRGGRTPGGRRGRRSGGGAARGRGERVRRAPATAPGGHRDGQVRCARTELRQRRRCHIRCRALRPAQRARGQRDDAGGLGGLFRGGRRPASGGAQRGAGPYARVAHRLLPALGQDLGVSGVAESTASRWRRGTWRALPDRLDADGVASLRARRLCGRGAGHAAAGGAAGARRCPRPRAQTRQRRVARRGVRRTATAAGSCP
ncbi:Uncharacterised protein [Mycobacterium tuberculosis]|nr:Uncharacterised protein [Mycobacterium tuberculosis]